MNKWLLLSFVLGLCMLSSFCAEKEYRIAVMFTSPEAKEIKHGGFYRLASTGDSIGMYGYAPSEYIFTLGEDDTVSGWAWKDTLEYHDSLHFELYVDGLPEVNTYILAPYAVVVFRYPSVE